MTSLCRDWVNVIALMAGTLATQNPLFYLSRLQTLFLSQRNYIAMMEMAANQSPVTIFINL